MSHDPTTVPQRPPQWADLEATVYLHLPVGAVKGDETSLTDLLVAMSQRFDQQVRQNEALKRDNANMKEELETQRQIVSVHLVKSCILSEVFVVCICLLYLNKH